MKVMQVFSLLAGSLCIDNQISSCFGAALMNHRSHCVDAECSHKHAGAAFPEKVCHKVGDSASSLRQGLQTRETCSLSTCDTCSNTCRANSSAQLARGGFLISVYE